MSDRTAMIHAARNLLPPLVPGELSPPQAGNTRCTLRRDTRGGRQIRSFGSSLFFWWVGEEYGEREKEKNEPTAYFVSAIDLYYGRTL